MLPSEVAKLKKIFLVVMAGLLASSNADAGKGYTNDTAPATCVDGDFWIDTNGTSTERFHICEEGTWVKHLGNGTTSNPSFVSVHASGGNLAAANAQVTKKWITGLSYTADVTSVIHGGRHWIAKTTHTAGSTTEPGVGANHTDAWTEVSGAGDNLGSATYPTVVALWASGSCSGYMKSDGTCDTPSGSATYPSTAGLANWNGSAWGTSQSLGTGIGAWLTTPSGANLASALTSALPASKGGTGLTALGTGVATAMGNAVNGTGGFATYDSIPAITWGTGLTDTSNTISVTNPVTAEAWSGSGWNADTQGLSRNDAYAYLHISDQDDDGKIDVLDMGAGIPKTDANGAVSVATAGTDYLTPTNLATGSTDNALIRADGTGGKTTQATGITVDDSDNLTTAGTLGGKIPSAINSATASYNVSVAQARASTLFLTTNTATTTYNLPAAEAGMSACFRMGQGNSQVLIIDTDGTDFIVMPTGARNTAGKYLGATASATNKICVAAYNDTDWYVESTIGTWTVEP